MSAFDYTETVVEIVLGHNKLETNLKQSFSLLLRKSNSDAGTVSLFLSMQSSPKKM